MAATTDRGISYYDGVPQEQTPLGDVAALALRSKLTEVPKGGVLLVMVGLPARGKSFMSAKLYSFVKWGGQKIKVFNVGSYRRAESSMNSSANFFDDQNEAASRKREELAVRVLDEALDWLAEKRVAIFDATNSTRARREAILARASSKSPPGRPVRVIFVESICDDRRVLEQNVRNKVRASPDFKGMNFDDAVRDLKLRLAHYESRYETVSDDEGAYIKSYNFSSKVTSHLCFGRMSKTILPFLIALHTDDRPIYLCALPPTSREPEKVMKLSKAGVWPSTSSLTSIGGGVDDFGDRLANFWWASATRTLCQLQTESRVLVLSSTMPQAVAAAERVADANPDLVTLSHTSALNPLLITPNHQYFTSQNNKSDDTDAETDNDDAEAASSRRQSFNDRGDGGESFADLVRRLETVVLDLESSVDPVLVVCHATPARALRAYFKNIDVFDISRHVMDPESQALADAAPAVLEVRQSMSGHYSEKVHWI
mmetsp:Transcript_22540/g.72516  ORF Transcript_22540/g.72516 Transcript_22540/m.72516 type:complete len:486 (+) Transcript_22540:24-1481(+)